MSATLGTNNTSDVATDEQDRTPTQQADICVVGAGPAGALIGYQLAKQDLDVVILEAGPEFSDADRLTQQEQHIRPGMSDPWEMGGQRDAYTTTGRGYPLNAARVKGVGGSTLHWQGMVMRLHERDFEMNTRYDVGVDWPIDYADLRSYYQAAESALGVAGAIDNPYAPPRETSYPLPPFPPSHSDSIFAPACETLGIDMHSVPNARNSERYDGRAACQGYGTCKPVCPSGAKYTAESHVQKARAAGARVIDRAPVQELVHDDAGEIINHAVYLTPDGTEYHQSAQRFVLACGGVENARLLLLSQSKQYPDGLANTSGAVGRFFTDHLFAGVGGRLDQPTRQNHVGFNTSECHQFYDDTSPVEGVKLEFLNYAGPSPVNEALTADTWGDELLEQLQTSYGNHIAVGGLIEQLPHASNRITLNDSETDEHGNPVPHIEWSIDDRTSRAIRRANDIQRRILETLGASIEWTVGPDATGPAYHQMGTTRMGTNPNKSVVDADCRSHELSNLWIIGSSVFPTGGAMNPTLTIAALSLRAADAIFATL
ncbi:GMC family oxidoreductase [Haloquadratum walsbyi]|nr:GMC family oxidoreductase [Haloquadratum walsbyi]